MKILAWPKTCPNPYTKILYDELERQGIEVLSHRDNRMAGIFYKVDILHFHWLGSFLEQKLMIAFFATFLYMLYIKILKFRGIKIIWTLHNSINFTHGNKNKWLEKILVPFLFDNVDKLIIHSKFQKKHINKKFHNKVIWIPHQNYCTTFVEKNLSKGSDYFLFFGAVGRYKGLEDAIVAYKNAKHNKQDLKPFKIVGKTNSIEYEYKITQLINGDDNIFFENRFVKDDELELLVKHAKAVILPYKQITNSGSLIYALSCKTKVIIKRSLLTDEILDDFPELDSALDVFDTIDELSIFLQQETNDDLDAYNRYISSTDVGALVRQYIQIFKEVEKP